MNHLAPLSAFFPLHRTSSIALALLGLGLGLGLAGCDPVDDLGDPERLEADSEAALDDGEAMTDLALTPPQTAEEAGKAIDVPDLDLVAPADPAAAAGWGPWISEESPPTTCDTGYVVTGLDCYGSNCDDVQLLCAPQPLVSGSSRWTSWFSEEDTSYRVCPGTEYVSGIACKGYWCDDISLECTDVGKSATSCQWSGYHGSNDPYFVAPIGTLVAGIQCSGAYCDEMRFFYCQV